jgi:hypothetical protein
MSSALLEATEIDERTARYVNDNLADYLLPVNADVQNVQILMLSERDDQVNAAGVKGLGELANVGTNAAVFNANGMDRPRSRPQRLSECVGACQEQELRHASQVRRSRSHHHRY